MRKAHFAGLIRVDYPKTIRLKGIMPKKLKNRHAVALRKLRTLKFFGQLPIAPKALHKKNPHAVALALMGSVKEAGRKGGRATAQNMTPEQRRERAVRAVMARWRNRVTPTSRSPEVK
jgi:hypothetical protein